jgi:hypothetical protein
VADFVTGYPTIDTDNQEITTRCYLSAAQANGFPISGLAEKNKDTIVLATAIDKFAPQSKGTSDEFIFINKERIL